MRWGDSGRSAACVGRAVGAAIKQHLGTRKLLDDGVNTPKHVREAEVHLCSSGIDIHGEIVAAEATKAGREMMDGGRWRR